MVVRKPDELHLMLALDFPDITLPTIDPGLGDVSSTHRFDGRPTIQFVFTPWTPLYSSQWHLKQLGLINRIWTEYSGKGIHVGIFDTGMETNHPSLAPNYDPSREVIVTYNGQQIHLDPTNASTRNHATSVAGLIAGSLSGQAIGVAFNAGITGVPLLDSIVQANPGVVEDILYNWQNFDVANNSWNYVYAFANPEYLLGAMAAAVQWGRNGLGTILVNSAGNEYGLDQRNANTSAFNSSRFTITVGALTAKGTIAYYSNRGASIFLTAPGGDEYNGLVTTDQQGLAGYSPGDYTSLFAGTSAAAPIVSGVVALMLQANPLLGWRDVQEILALSAHHTSAMRLSAGLTASGSTYNGGGLYYTNDYGYGAVDAYAAVRMAEIWSSFGPAQTWANESFYSSISISALSGIVANASASYRLKFTTPLIIEHIDLDLRGFSGDWSQIKVSLSSPTGQKSILLTPGGFTIAGKPTEWSLGSEAFRDQSLSGIWTLRIDNLSTMPITFTGSMMAYGHAPSVNNVYHFTDEFGAMVWAQPSRRTIVDNNGGTDWLDLSAVSTAVSANLYAGQSTYFARTWFQLDSTTQIENIITGDGNDTIIGNALNNTLYGMRGDDTLFGEAANDLIWGGQGSDQLYGGDGDDTLIAGEGVDTLYGGDGNDVFRIDSAANSTTAVCIMDFSYGQDLIDLSQVHMKSGRFISFLDLHFSSGFGPRGALGTIIDLGDSGAGLFIKNGFATLDPTPFKFA